MLATTPIVNACFRLVTKIGPITAEFSNSGLKRLDYETQSDLKPENDVIDRFNLWLHKFENATPAEQWAMLDPGGTAFQRAVWKKLLKIPFGKTTSYGMIAKELDKPSASRAVGSAVGANPICLLIPCHRVLPASGQSGNYRWGAAIKRALLDVEREESSNLQSLFK